MSLDCFVGENLLSGKPFHKALLDIDKSRLATIYAKCLASIARLVAFGRVSCWFAVLESSLTSLMRQISELAKKLNLLMLTVFQPSLGCQLLVISSLQDQVDDIVIGKSLNGTTGGKTAVILDSSVFLEIKRLENMLEEFFALVLSLTARFDDSILADSGYLGVSVAMVIDNSLAKHICKIFEVFGWLISIKLFFKNKISVSILGIYTDAFLAVRFSQAGEINFMIAKAVNKSFFIVLSGNFNKDGSHKCTSFKKCLNLGLVNSLGGSSYVKTPTWANFRDVAKTIDFLFISLNLVNAVVDRNIFDIGEFFDTNHQTVFMLMSLDRLLDMQLNSLHK
ncbi:hypothetical protein G9A89_013942 [Geosiphon pyriformis]|nr:hypothetical protein G9A89_013942 [Geosiphon pyriformis]